MLYYFVLYQIRISKDFIYIYRLHPNFLIGYPSNLSALTLNLQVPKSSTPIDLILWQVNYRASLSLYYMINDLGKYRRFYLLVCLLRPPQVENSSYQPQSEGFCILIQPR